MNENNETKESNLEVSEVLGVENAQTTEAVTNVQSLIVDGSIPFRVKNNSDIVALIYVSESELFLIDPTYNALDEEDDSEGFKQTLWSLGCDVTYPYSRQDFIWHRNRFDEKVFCSRWVCNERTDKAWIESGHASQATKDKASENWLVTDSYRQRMLTNDAQAYLESRDRYTKIDFSHWED